MSSTLGVEDMIGTKANSKDCKALQTYSPSGHISLAPKCEGSQLHMNIPKINSYKECNVCLLRVSD